MTNMRKSYLWIGLLVSVLLLFESVTGLMVQEPQWFGGSSQPTFNRAGFIPPSGTNFYGKNSSSNNGSNQNNYGNFSSGNGNSSGNYGERFSGSNGSAGGYSGRFAGGNGSFNPANFTRGRSTGFLGFIADNLEATLSVH